MTAIGFLTYLVAHAAVFATVFALPAFCVCYIVWRCMGSPRPWEHPFDAHLRAKRERDDLP